MILSFWGCSNDKDFGGLENIGWNEKPLQITTRILTTKSTNFIQEFKEGSMLGLQITSGTVDDLYNGISTYKNVSVKAYRVNGKIRWQQSPEVILDSNEATIYAYYPYQEDINFNARQIPVKLAPNALETDDYMYGTHAIGQKAVNSTSPLVLLSMNHALSLISFQLNLSKGKTGAFIISSVQVGNKPGGTTLSSFGTSMMFLYPNFFINASTISFWYFSFSLLNFCDLLSQLINYVASFLGKTNFFVSVHLESDSCRLTFVQVHYV